TGSLEQRAGLARRREVREHLLLERMLAPCARDRGELAALAAEQPAAQQAIRRDPQRLGRAAAQVGDPVGIRQPSRRRPVRVHAPLQPDLDTDRSDGEDSVKDQELRAAQIEGIHAPSPLHSSCPRQLAVIPPAPPGSGKRHYFCGKMSYMARLLSAWIGRADLRAAAGDPDAERGPIACAATDRRFDEIVLLSSQDEDETRGYVAWLRRQSRTPLIVHRETGASPEGYRDIHDLALRAVVDARQRHGADAALTFHLSPGAPAMAAVWILLAQTRFDAELFESSKARGVWTSSVALDLAGDLLPDLLHRADVEIVEHAAEWPSGEPGFGALVHRSPPMRRLVARARRVALRRVPVLVEGESGTGKELLARAIHLASAAAGAPFVAVNCGAIPEGL